MYITLHMKNITFLFYLLLICSAIPVRGNFQKTIFDRTAFYNALSSENIDEVNTQLSVLKGASLNGKEAFEGTLLMKKAGLVAKAKDKISLFKEGRKKLEASIKKDSENTEYCFLRLIIQEHAPKAVEYRNDIDHDSKLIRSAYKNLPSTVQLAVVNYSKKSRALKDLLP